jgi:hypothetical protein
MHWQAPFEDGLLCTRTGTVRLVRCRWALALLGVPIMFSSLVAPGTSSADALSLGTTVLGVFTGTSNPAGVQAFDASVGYRVRWAMDTTGAESWSVISNGNPAVLRSWGASRYRMIWAVPMLPTGKATAMAPPLPGVSLSVEATGGYNHYFNTFGKNLVANHQADAIIRFGWEFNGDWAAWSANPNNPKTFVVSFRQLVRTFRAVPGNHFTFEWNPNPGADEIPNLTKYYPGNAYVNYVSLDVYDIAWKSYPGRAANWQRLLTEPNGLDWLAKFAADNAKPITIPEFGLGWGPSPSDDPSTGPGVVQGGDDPYFIRKMAAWCSSHQVLYAAYFLPTGPIDDGKNPLTLEALRTAW